ncbi:ABC transporter ATP-binding protein/permease [Microbacterium sp. GXF0217]
MTTITLDNVSRRFGRGAAEVTAVDRVSLQIRSGEYVSVMGESGSGKSTLIGILGLLDRPTAGHYRLDSTLADDVDGATQARLRSQYFSHIFQSFHLLERRPAVDSVGLALLYRGLHSAEIDARSHRALEMLGLADRASTPGALLSGGERQRVAVARGIASRTPFLIADEPTGNLDSVNSDKVIAALEAAHRSGAAVVIVTHSRETAARAGRTITLRDGQVKDDSAPNGVAQSQAKAVAPPGLPSRVRPGTMLRDIWKNVVSRRARLLSYAAAIAMSVALVMTTLGLSHSATHQVSLAFDATTSREITVSRLLSDTVAPLGDDTIGRVSELNGVVAVADAVETSAQIQRNPGSELVDTSLFFVRGDVVVAGRLSLEEGSQIAASGLKPGEALVGAALASRLNIPAADTDSTVVVNGQTYLVRGIIEDSPREASWIGAILVAPRGESVGVGSEARTLITTKPGAAIQVSKEIPLVIDPAAPERVDLSSPPDPSAMRQGVESSVHMTLILLTLAAILGSIVAIALASLSAASERRVEFGLRRAVGARHQHILAMLAGEAALYGVVGAACGAFLGMAALLAVTILNRWTPIFDVRLLFIAVAAGVLVSVLGSFAGAIRALRMQPGEALRPAQ